MGFWGTFLVARANRPIEELDWPEGMADRIVSRDNADGGWQVLRLHRWPADVSPETAGREAVLVSMMEQTRHPVLAGTVFDSDGAQLIGYGPRTGRWGGWLTLDRIMAYLDPDAMPYAYEDDDGGTRVEQPDEQTLQQVRDRLYAVCPPAAVAAPLALRWAAEAGLNADPASVRATLDAHAAFAEDLFFELLAALGLPGVADGGPLKSQ